MDDADRQARMRSSWHEVAEGFSTLGRTAKERYRAGEPEFDPDAERDTEREAASSAALKAALEQLMAAGRELGERVADVARDEELRAQAKRTSASLDEALTATVDLIEEQVSGLLQRRRSDPPAGPGWDPPTGPPA